MKSLKKFSLLLIGALTIIPGAQKALAADEASSSAGEGTGDKFPKAETPSRLSENEVLFLTKLHEINRAEIEVGTLAKKSPTTAVRDYGAMLVDGHKTADKKVIDLATKYNADITIAAFPRKDLKEMRDNHKKLGKDLDSASGKEFDRKFTDAMVAGHNGAITLIQESRQSATHKEIRGLADDLLPEITSHRDQAMNLQKGLAH